MIKITKEEFKQRISSIQNELDMRGLDGMMVYGDEYRKENLRYVSNFWPIFERGACFIPKSGEPVFAGAPEGEKYAREMCVWQDIRNIGDFSCVTVSETIDYPLANFSSLKEIISEILGNGRKLALVGYSDIPLPLFEKIRSSVADIEIVNCNDILNKMRLFKSEDEINCLKEAGRIACAGYEHLMKAAVPGNTERYAAGAGEGEARKAGAEDVNFMVFGSGKRTETIIGRATDKIIEDGDMIMASMAIQYEGYVATVEFPFVAGNASEKQKAFINILLEAADKQLSYLRDGVVAGEMVNAVKSVFEKYGVEKYDVYPPMHGIGLAEAESPYPSANSSYTLQKGMCVNSDISLFGHPAGSNRIEEGFVITENGPLSITPLVRELCRKSS